MTDAAPSAQPAPQTVEDLTPVVRPAHTRLALLALAIGGFAIGTTEFVTMGLLPEVARGVARGVIEQALAASSPALSSQYAVTVAPDPAGGDCEIVLRLAPLRRSTTRLEAPLR